MGTYLKDTTLLYVEDDLSISELIKEYLEKRVKTLYIANDGVEGLKLYKKHSPDIVLSDIVMPNMDGLKMLEDIKSIKKDQLTALFTAFDEKEYFIKAIELGVSKFFSKPILDLQGMIGSLEDLACDFHARLALEHNIELEKKVNRLDAVSSILLNIAHQWRQPLAIISTQISGLKLSLEFGDQIDDKTLHDTFDSVVHQTQYLSKTIEDSATFFKSFEQNDGVENLQDIIDVSLKYFKDEIDKHNIKIVSRIDDKVCQSCDKFLVAMALQNMIRNSIDALIKIPEQDRYIVFDTKCRKDQFCLTIQDSGGGVDQSILEKIFEPYTTTKHQFMGVGFSLFMTYQIVKNHLKRNITVKNESLNIDDKKLYGAKFIIE